MYDMLTISTTTCCLPSYVDFTAGLLIEGTFFALLPHNTLGVSCSASLVKLTLMLLLLSAQPASPSGSAHTLRRVHTEQQQNRDTNM